jgi:hypothetical protein
VIRLVRIERLTLRDSLLWLVSTLLALVTIAVPDLLFVTARVLGILVPSNALFVLTGLYLLLNLFSVTVGRLFRVGAHTAADAGVRAAARGDRAPPPRPRPRRGLQKRPH